MGDLIGLIIFMIIASSVVRNIAEKVKGPGESGGGGDIDGSSLEEQLKRLLGESEPEGREAQRPQSPTAHRPPPVQRPTIQPTKSTPPPMTPPPVRRPAGPTSRPVAPPRQPAYEARPQPQAQPSPPLEQPRREKVSRAQPTMSGAPAEDSLRQEFLERQRKLQAASEPRKFTKPLEARPYARKKASRMRKKFNLNPTILAQAVVLSEVIQPPLALRQPE